MAFIQNTIQLDTIKTFRDDHKCKILETPLGNLAVYGTIIGKGNRKPNFEEDLGPTTFGL